MTFPKNKEVRDLYWIIKGPGFLNSDHPKFAKALLTDDWYQEQTCQAEEWFRRCDGNPVPLIEDLNQRKNPTLLLGRYFEALLSFWIREYLKPEAFYASVPVHEHEASKSEHGRRTIGEFDFLFRLPQSAQDSHWEAAVKFYLFCGESEDNGRQANFYVGTQVHDRLDIKIRRIFEHQLRLGEAPDGKALLEKLGLSDLRSEAWVKGALFYPSDSDWKNHPHPPEVSPTHARGWWTQVDVLNLPIERAGSRWVALPKYHWLSPVEIEATAAAQPALLTQEEMKGFCRSHFAEHMSPLMWAEVAHDPALQSWREINRGLVVYSGWLVKARGAVSPTQLYLS